MKTKYLVWILAVLPALGGFIGPYLSGRNIISFGTGDMLIGFLSVALLPWVTVPIIAIVTTKQRWYRIGLLLPIFVVEVAAYLFVGPMARAHTIGVAHRLTENISPVEIQRVAMELSAKQMKGTIKTTNIVLQVHGLSGDNNLFVDKSELPKQLQSKLNFVVFHNKRDIVFAVNSSEGFYWTSTNCVIGCDSIPVGHNLWVFRYGR